jgi:hypothetical protein
MGFKKKKKEEPMDTPFSARSVQYRGRRYCSKHGKQAKTESESLYAPLCAAVSQAAALPVMIIQDEDCTDDRFGTDLRMSEYDQHVQNVFHRIY